MADAINFESRKGYLTCTAAELYDFVTDIRNFQQFIPKGISVDDMLVDRDSCRFIIAGMGSVSVKLSEKRPFDKVVYSGIVFQINSFSLTMDINENPSGRAEVSLLLAAHVNPLLQMVASKPARDFLEKVIDEMENFSGWNNINK